MILPMEASTTAFGSRTGGWQGRVAIVAGAILLGLLLQSLLGSRLTAIQELASRDMLAARGELANLLRVVGVLVFGPTTLVGVLLLVHARRALALGVFPPPGLWSSGARPIVTGLRAIRLARIAMVLAALLALLSVAALGLSVYAAEVLQACQAGIS